MNIDVRTTLDNVITEVKIEEVAGKRKRPVTRFEPNERSNDVIVISSDEE